MRHLCSWFRRCRLRGSANAPVRSTARLMLDRQRKWTQQAINTELRGASQRGRSGLVSAGTCFPYTCKAAELADEVAHLFALGLEVTLVGGLGGDLGGDALDDLNSGEFK